ncbi:hypothetical protein IKF34_00880 [Candidatus Saccharibacteria bacterium]|nr:hypothetical protein [Candidatus Saccharibacteria bacterium]
MGIFKLFKSKKKDSSAPKPPELVRRRENRRSNLVAGRTIGEKREKLETANERTAARKKAKQAKITRIVITTCGFLVLIGALVMLFRAFTISGDTEIDSAQTESFAPTIPIEDEASGTNLSNRMKSYIGRAEKDLRDLGYTPIKAVIPASAIREVDIYLENPSIFVKMILDRETSVSAEDADRVIRHLSGEGVGDYTYIDVRVEGKAYWK